ncbi:cytochrome P450 [Xylariales sp. PMI_506]|nr:cytochrome P450 [Xylariales sp. PMI_506]
MVETTPIPEPPALPFLGHATSIDTELPLRTFLEFADKYGEVFRLRLPGRNMVMVSSHRLIDEVSDETRFKKVPSGPLEQIRNGVHDGLFTARLEEPNWGIAHRVLMPAFGPVSIRGMFDEMHDIATQLTMKWARYGSSNPIMVTDDFTRLALDTLALCAMGYRFNSFYALELHPFVRSMGDFLVESGNRSRRPPLPSFFYKNQDAKYWSDIEVLRNTAEEVLKERQSGDSERKDLLQAMLKGIDPKNGVSMSDSSIVDNLITFLIAGHETTSGLLSFAFYELLKHPEAYRKVQQEVDTVVGKGPIQVEHMTKLPYIAAVLRETLRVNSPITIYSVRPIEDTLLAGKYPVTKDDGISMFVMKSHRDPKVYGDDANDFKPERMLDENFEKLPKNAWKPFGNGVRACIGRPFAWQEAVLVMAMLFQNFNFVPDDPNYNLHFKQTLTIKPKDFYMRAILRDGLTPTSLEHRLAGNSAEPVALASHSTPKGSTAASAAPDGKPLTILYGSNSGTCEAMARRLASDAPQHGFRASTVDCLDAANDKISKDQPVVIITASYEGQPPDNARHFVSYIENLKNETALNGVSYAVFGCGHHDWAQTFHRIPKLVDTLLEKNGATRLAQLGTADAGGSDMFVDFETWEDTVLWPALSKKYGAEGDKVKLTTQGTPLKVSISSPRASALRSDVQEAEVVATKVLTAEGEPVKKSIEIKLPSDTTYRSGDYVAVLPINPRENVQRVLRRFQLPWDAYITIESNDQIPLPTNVSVSASDVFGAYVELSQPATKRNILALGEATEDKQDKTALKNLAGESYEAEISNKRTSIIDLLEKYPSVNLPIGSYLAMLPPMRVRQYSISSSPLWNPSNITLTYALLEEDAKSGKGRYVGVASSYLSGLQPGDRLHVSIRASHTAFHLPTTPEQTPVICVAAGTGLAPFRGFVQERAAMIGAGRKLAPMVMYYGCREPGRDDLYTDELAEWERMGAVTVKRTFSRTPEKSGGHRYVQDQVWADREEVVELWRGGARLYICGSRAVGTGMQDVVLKISKTRAEKLGEDKSEEDISAWWDGLRNVRYATDVFD